MSKRKIEFDASKDAANLAKHGVSLMRAADLDVVFAYFDQRKDYGEARVLAYGYIDGLPHVLCYVDRGASMRAISLRRAHEKEFSRHGKKSQS
jgi:uncharacterized DUF497 family protein